MAILSRPLANALLAVPHGDLVVDAPYYTYLSVFFYTNRTAWLLNGRFNNLVYGSYAPALRTYLWMTSSFMTAGRSRNAVIWWWRTPLLIDCRS